MPVTRQCTKDSLVETGLLLTTDNISVVCVKFGTGYDRQYVEKLRNMVARHLTLPYEFVCLTDDATPFDNVRSIVQPNGGYAKQWWHKIHLFDRSLSLNDTVLYFDLDVVICSNVDKLVTNDISSLFGIRDFNRKYQPDLKRLNSSVMAWNRNRFFYLYDQFTQEHYSPKFHGDQDWIWHSAQHKIKFWPDEWIQSYKWEIRNKQDLSHRAGVGGFKNINNNTVIDRECCVAVFHGNPNPADVQDKFVLNNWQ